MNVTDIIEAAQESNPSLEVTVTDNDGEDQVLVLRNILLMKPADRKSLYSKIDEIRTMEASEDDDRDNLTVLAEAVRDLLRQFADNKTNFKHLEKAFKASGFEDAAWIELFNTYQKTTRLGEADTSQTS